MSKKRGEDNVGVFFRKNSPKKTWTYSSMSQKWGGLRGFTLPLAVMQSIARAKLVGNLHFFVSAKSQQNSTER